MFSAVEVGQGSECDPWYSQAGALGGQSSEFLWSTRGGGPAHFSVQMEFLSKCPDLWFGAFQVLPKGISIIRHYPSLDRGLDITVRADSDSMLDR